MSEIYIISDTHFGHDNIIKYCKRPFHDSREMNEKILDNLNAIIKPQDHLWHLGDVYFKGGFKTEEEIHYLFNRIPGKKRLILGNHDQGKDPILHKYFQKIELWRMFPEFGLLLTHIPVHESTLGIIMRPKEFYNDVDWEGLPGAKRQLKNVHGHIHQNKSPEGPYINACVEWTDYKPINLELLRTK